MNTSYNAVQFDRARRADHVESYFLKLNEKGGDRAVWLKATIFASALEPSRPVAEGWAIAFDRRGSSPRHVAVKHSLPFDLASFSARELAVDWSIQPAAPPLGAPVSAAPPARSPDFLSLRDGATRGSISLREHRVRWDLRFTGDESPLAPLPFQAMYGASFPSAKLVSPYPDLRFDGEVDVDGEAWAIEGWRGMQGHNWGRRHADLYAWSHANVWEEADDFVLEGFSASVRVGPVRTPLMTLICARHRGVRYEWNAPLDIARARGEVTPRRWSFSATGNAGSIEGSLEADADDMVGLYYPNPHGPMTYCLNTKLARARVRFEARGRPPLSLTSRAAALEIGTRDEGHGIRMYV